MKSASDNVNHEL